MAVIVHVANFYREGSGGIRTMMNALGPGYQAAGHEFVMVVPGAVDADERIAHGRRITLRSPILPGSGGYRLIVRRRDCAAILEGLAPDRIEVSDRSTTRWIGDWARERGVPTVMFAHERLDGVLRAFSPVPLPATAIADWHNRGSVSSFDTIVATTRFAADEFNRIGAGNLRRVVLGVDLVNFSPVRADPALRARYLPATPGAALLVMSSRLSREKQPWVAIEATRVLHEQGHPVHLLILGVGPLAERLQRQARGLPVTFLGFVADRAELAALLATADVAIAPGPLETFGLAALESLASGTPAVVSRLSGLSEVVLPDGGVSVSGEPAAWADAVRSVLAEDVDTRRHRARARAERFTWQATVDAMLSLHRLDSRLEVSA